MSPHHSGRLSPTDASFLYLERRECPMHIGALCRFDGELPFDRYRESIAAKLTRLPRFRERVVPAPWNLGHPTWETDPDFDLDRHVVLHRLEGDGDEEDLRAKVNELVAARLDRECPLWELHVIHGLADGSSAVLSKVHHAMVDGVGGNAILTTIMDLERDPPPPSFEDRYQPTTPLDRRARIGDAIWDATRGSIDSWSNVLRSLTEVGRHFDFEKAQSVLAVWGETLPTLLRPPRSLPFNRACSGERNFQWTRVSFAEARAIRAALGGTVNDVVLAALGGAVGKYLEHHGQDPQGRMMRVMVPVNARPAGAAGDLGNQVSVLPVGVPIGLSDPVHRLKVIRGTTRTLKDGMIADGVSLFSGLGGAVPPPLFAAFGSMAVASAPPFNMVCTNVPGPQIPLYACGHRLRAYYPYVPVGFQMGVGCAIFSYDQQLFIGLNSDRKACPDADVLCGFLDDAFAEMRDLAGVEVQPAVELGVARSRRKTRSKGRS